MTEGNPVPRRTFLTGASAVGVGALMWGGQVQVAEAAKNRTLLRNTLDRQSDWERFLSRLDLQWQKIPRTFYEGPFLGNGAFGAALYQVDNEISFTLGHSAVRDHQKASTDALFFNAQLPIGRMSMKTRGEVREVDLRLSLADARVHGTVTTTKGVIELSAFISSETDLLVVKADPRRGEKIDWKFTPYAARTTRLDFRARPEGLLDNPEPEVHADRVVQRLASGGSTTTAWRQKDDDLVVTVAHSHPENDSEQIARRAVRGADARSVYRAHARWWYRYYSKSFVSIPDARLQSFYWIQLYKLASATREGEAPIRTDAQWIEPTPWPAAWWNLNVQLQYWPINATAHYELDSLTSSLDTYRDNLVLNVPEKYRDDSSAIARTTQEDLLSVTMVEPPGKPDTPGGSLELGNLTWALHNVWLRYRHTMDEKLLRDVLFPILRRAVNFNLHFLQERADGRLHMPRTYSPEYDYADDCNYTLALLNWGCRTLLEAAKILGIDDELAPRWRDVVKRMVDPPQGEDGLWIGGDRQLNSSHRHYSHLLWFYPLYVLDVEDQENRDLLERSLATWVSYEGALQGYTFTGAASMSAMLGKGDDALRYLNTLLDKFVQPNTMYAETGPVIETPLSGAQSIHDMVISSWGDKIRVFPGVPSAWRDVTVHQLRTEGAFEVSASRAKGRTAWIHVKSLAGQPLRLVPGDLKNTAQVIDAKGRPIKHTFVDGVLSFTLPRGGEALILAAGADRRAVVGPVTRERFTWGKPGTPRGRSVPVDLSRAYNNDGISTAANTADGDLGIGFTLPAEDLPPAGKLFLGGIDWLFPSGADGDLNNVIPDGQEVAVKRDRYARVNVIGTSVPKAAGEEFQAVNAAVVPITAVYRDGSTMTVDLRLSIWDRQSSEGDDVAAEVRRRHFVTGSTAPPALQRARIYHQWVDIDSRKELVAVRLGQNKNAATNNGHLFAISLEKPIR